MNLRLDDLGASSKQYERWSRHRWANVWPLHDRRLFGAWGPYRELAPWQMEIIFSACARARRVLIVAITANWVEADGTLLPYAEKFPDQARVVVAHATRGSIEVALHGWTHCIPDRGRHLPRWIGSNRAWHREPEAIEPSVGCKWFGYALGVPVTQYVAPGSPVPEGWRVWHDRDFVLHWEDSMDELEAALCARD